MSSLRSGPSTIETFGGVLASFPGSCEWAQEPGNEVNGVHIHLLAWPRPIRTGSDISNGPECRSGNGAIPNVDSTSVVITTAYHQSVLYFFLCHVTWCPRLPGVPVVVSLKTRLLALQVLGAIMAELSENSPLDHTTCTKVR